MIRITRKIKIGYFCSFVPMKLLEQYGLEMIQLSEKNLENLPDNPEMLNTLCSFALKSTSVIEAYDLDGLIITNCCNSMQRAYDYLIHIGKKVYMLDIIRDQTENEEEYYNKMFHSILGRICKDFNIEEKYGGEKYRLNWSAPKWICERNTKSVLVLANIISKQVEEIIKQICSPFEILIKSCNKVISEEETSTDGLTFTREPCVHSYKYSQWIEEFLDFNKENIGGIIFLTSPYCDVSLFQYPYVKKKAKEYDIPIICLKNSFSFSGMGQVTTRLEAFMEGIYNRDIFKYHISSIESIKMRTSISLFQRMRYVNALAGKMDYEFLNMIISYQMDLVLNKLRQERDRIVWTNMVMPVEIFYSMGLIPVHIELISGWLASLGVSKEYIIAAESMEISNEVCSYHKAIIGLMDSEESLHPKLMALASTICDGGLALADYCSHKYGTNVFRIEVPYDKNEDTVRYVQTQYENLSHWIQRMTTAQYSEEKFIQSLELTNEARKVWIEANKLRKYAQDFDGRLTLRNLFGVTFLFGTEIGLNIVKEYKKALLSLKQNKEWPNNKKKILWIHFSPLYKNELLEYMEKELGLIVIADAVSYIYWDEYKLKDCSRDVSERLLSNFYIGDEVRRKKIYEDMIDENQIDGVIHYIQRGCRTIGGSSWLVRELAKEKSIPYMELSGDCIDPRGNTSQQDFTRLEAFKESLEGV